LGVKGLSSARDMTNEQRVKELVKMQSDCNASDMSFSRLNISGLPPSPDVFSPGVSRVQSPAQQQQQQQQQGRRGAARPNVFKCANHVTDHATFVTVESLTANGRDADVSYTLQRPSRQGEWLVAAAVVVGHVRHEVGRLEGGRETALHVDELQEQLQMLVAGRMQQHALVDDASRDVAEHYARCACHALHVLVSKQEGDVLAGSACLLLPHSKHSFRDEQRVRVEWAVADDRAAQLPAAAGGGVAAAAPLPPAHASAASSTVAPGFAAHDAAARSALWEQQLIELFRKYGSGPDPVPEFAVGGEYYYLHYRVLSKDKEFESNPPQWSPPQ